MINGDFPEHSPQGSDQRMQGAYGGHRLHTYREGNQVANMGVGEDGVTHDPA